MKKAELGKTGEAVAAKYYLNKGCKLLAHNYRTRMGELDLVIQDQNEIVIVEVKTRTKSILMHPAEAVNSAKQKKIILATEQFLQQFHLQGSCVRFDVVEVIPGESGWQIHCIKNAFEI